MSITMTVEERGATEAFHKDLMAEFDANAQVMWAAKAAGETGRYNECVEETRRLYREIKEVEFALESNTLPFLQV